jgi:DNA-binding NtrC family response regulator
LRERLRDLLDAAIERERENQRIAQQMLGLGVIGASPRITSVFRWIVRASAVSDLPVLIVGETGTGKELAARAIHRLDGRRREAPFIPVNCGAISAGLAESELFGHRRGSFTGADYDRLGLIRAARGGVLFLDEVGDLELGLQGKLLRVLQERRVLAVGDDRELPVDARIIAATNRDLSAMVKQHTFRADLFHRLNVLSVDLPALRDRREDIEPLVQHFLAHAVDRAGGADVSVSREFVDALRRAELPGNVRQLENVIRRALVTARRGEPLRLHDLPPELWLELSRAEGADRTHVEAPPREIPQGGAPLRQGAAPLDAVAVLDATKWKLEGALDLCEQQLVAAALGASRGNRSRAARLLGISPRCIFNKMRKHRLTA